MRARTIVFADTLLKARIRNVRDVKFSATGALPVRSTRIELCEPATPVPQNYSYLVAILISIG